MSRLFALACLLAFAAGHALPAAAQARNVNVRVDRPGAPVPRTLFGLFFEDINFGADGGKVFLLVASDLKAENSLEAPTRISPSESPLAVTSGEFSYALAPHSLTVLRVGVSAR